MYLFTGNVTDEKVFFEAYRRTDYSTVHTFLPYDTCPTNVGNAMNCSTGVFVAPVKGLYQFHLSTYSVACEANLALYKQGYFYFLTGAKVEKDQYEKSNAYASMSHVFMLNSGDNVGVYFQTGGLSGLVTCGTCGAPFCSGECVHTAFTGALIYTLD